MYLLKKKTLDFDLYLADTKEGYGWVVKSSPFYTLVKTDWKGARKLQLRMKDECPTDDIEVVME